MSWSACSSALSLVINLRTFRRGEALAVKVNAPLNGGLSFTHLHMMLHGYCRTAVVVQRLPFLTCQNGQVHPGDRTVLLDSPPLWSASWVSELLTVRE